MAEAQLRPFRAILCRLRFGLVLLLVAVPISKTAAFGWNDTPIVDRNMNTLRYGAAKRPRSEFEQKLYLNWPLYRNTRGQGAFNATMATLKATEGKPPAGARFKGCRDLHCPLRLPEIGRSGWFPVGRMWVSPTDYVLFVRWPRRPPAFVKRRSRRSMRYFVFHEFHNGTSNTDPYDTLSSHNRRVFVPFYLGKTMRDAQGRSFVAVIQVAPYDVRSIHASNRGSAGPGIEVAKNRIDALEPLQAKAGILVATIVKHKAPQLQVVNHRGSEGRPMLRAYMERIKGLRREPNSKRLALPFVSAREATIKNVRAPLTDLIRLPASFQSIMLGYERVTVKLATVRPPRPKLMITPILVRRGMLPVHRTQSAAPSAVESKTPLNALLRANSDWAKSISPPKPALRRGTSDVTFLKR